MNVFPPIHNNKLNETDSVTKNIDKDIHFCFIKNKYQAGALLFRTFLLHIAYDHDFEYEGLHGVFEKAIDYIDNNFVLYDNKCHDKLNAIRSWYNDIAHDVNCYNDIDKTKAISIWSWVIALIEWNN